VASFFAEQATQQESPLAQLLSADEVATVVSDAVGADGAGYILRASASVII
jgi:hypothetical protein